MGRKISAATSASSVNAGQEFPVNGGGQPYKVTAAQIAAYASTVYEYTTGKTLAAAIGDRALASDLTTHANLTDTAHGATWKVLNGYIVPTAGNAAYPIKLTTTAATFTTAYAALTNAGANLTDGGTYWVNTRSGTPAAVTGTMSADSDQSGLYTAAKGADGNTSTLWSSDPVPGDHWLKVQFAAAKYFHSLRYYSNDGVSNVKDYKIQGSNDNSNWSDLLTVTGDNNTGWGAWKEATGNLGEYLYVRMLITATQGSNNPAIREIEYRYLPYSATLNTIDTPNLVSSGSLSFNPASLVVKDDAGATVTTGNCNIAYRTVIGGSTTDFSAPITIAAFKALPVGFFAGCTELKLRLQPVDAQKVAQVLIDSVAAYASLDPSGVFTMSYNGTVSHLLTSAAVSFNLGAVDCDFKIMAATSGIAYLYDAGNTAHNWYGTNMAFRTTAGGNINLNPDGVDTDVNLFRKDPLAAGYGDTTFLSYDCGTDVLRIDSFSITLATDARNKIGIFGATPIVRYNTTGTVTGFVQVSGSNVTDASTFTGNTGSTAYTVGDIVRALKLYGWITA